MSSYVEKPEVVLIRVPIPGRKAAILTASRRYANWIAAKAEAAICMGMDPDDFVPLSLPEEQANGEFLVWVPNRETPIVALSEAHAHSIAAEADAAIREGADANQFDPNTVADPNATKP